MPNNFYELLKYAATGIASPDMTYYDRMRASTLMGGTVKTLTGQPPLTFKSDGKPLISWSMKGNGQQNGTPTPDAPIMPTFCGTLDGTDWKIPITCAGQTVPVYLGQVSTVRRVKKLVLTGEENWRLARSGGLFVISSIHGYYRVTGEDICRVSHYTSQLNVNSNLNVLDKHAAFYTNPAYVYDDFYIYDSDYADASAFKQFLRDEYANGTPVMVWHVLAEPETGIVNEPLCKIGDYADELHSEDAGVTIPTVKGQNTLNVGTDLQPSEMAITYRG